MVARLAAQPGAHPWARRLSLEVTGARAGRPHRPTRGLVRRGPCDPCLHVWGKVERGHQMGGFWVEDGAAISRKSKSGMVRPSPSEVPQNWGYIGPQNAR